MNYQPISLKQTEQECCYFSHWIKKIYEQEGISTIVFPQDIRLENVGRLFTKEGDISTPLIPRISNQIWFTSPNSPREISDSNLLTTLKTKMALESTGHEWKHLIWTNKVGMKLKSINILGHNGFEVNLVDDLNIKAFDLNELIEQTRYGMASDALRVFIVEKIGGIYRDLDYEIYKPEALELIMSNFNYFGGMDGETYLGNAFFGGTQNHPVLAETVSLISRNFDRKHDNRPDYIDRPCDFFTDVITKTGPTVFTVANYHKLNTEGNVDIILSPGVIFNICEARGKEWQRLSGMTCSNFKGKDLYLLGLIGNDEYKATWAGPKSRFPYPLTCEPKEQHYFGGNPSQDKKDNSNASAELEELLVNGTVFNPKEVAGETPKTIDSLPL